MSDLPVVYGEVGLSLKRTLEWSEAEVMANTLSQFTRGLAWWFGDFLVYASKAFPGKWSQLIPADLNPNTCRNWMWVAERWPVKYRKPDVPWSVYQALAGVDPIEAREDLLRQAESQKMSRRQVVDIVREVKGQIKPIKVLTCPKCGWEWNE